MGEDRLLWRQEFGRPGDIHRDRQGLRAPQRLHGCIIGLTSRDKRENLEVADLGQYAALPYILVSGDLRICLITSRDTKRWVIPKGWPKAGLDPHELAAKEAVEEAGLIGEIETDPIGTYSYSKRLQFLSSVTCRVTVFPLLVHTQRVHWREQRERTLAWMSPTEAAGSVLEPDLSRLLAALPDWVGQRVLA